VGFDTARAVFDIFTVVEVVPAALIAQHIQWAIAEQTIKIFIGYTFVTWEILAFFVLVKFVMFHVNTSPSLS
jgi:hypothetical protein